MARGSLNVAEFEYRRGVDAWSAALTRVLLDALRGGVGLAAFALGVWEEAVARHREERPRRGDTGYVEDIERRVNACVAKRRDGTVPEWPSFVLGARDPHAAAALRAYAWSASVDPEFSKAFLQRLLKLADEFDAYRAAHGDGDPAKGIHRKDDPATVAEMREGRSA